MYQIEIILVTKLFANRNINSHREYITKRGTLLIELTDLDEIICFSKKGRF